MSIIIDGTNGISDIDGTASTPAIRGTDANTGIFFPAADTIAFAEGGTEVARIDSSGNVGIGGTATSGYKLDVQVSGTSRISVRDTSSTGIARVVANSVDAFFGNESSTGSTIFQTQATERMRIDSSGNVSVKGSGNYITLSCDNNSTTGGGIFTVKQNGTNSGFMSTRGSALGSTSRDMTIYAETGLGIYTYTNGGTAGPYVASGGTSWTNSSDERLKNITGEIENGLSKVCSLRAAEFTWKSDDEVKPHVGLIAQDVLAVLPEAVNQSILNKDDDTEYYGVSYTDVIPLLVAAIKELKSELDATKAEVAALKAKE